MPQRVDLKQEYPSCIATAILIVQPDMIYNVVSFDGSNISGTET